MVLNRSIHKRLSVYLFPSAIMFGNQQIAAQTSSDNKKPIVHQSLLVLHLQAASLLEVPLMILNSTRRLRSFPSDVALVSMGVSSP